MPARPSVLVLRVLAAVVPGLVRVRAIAWLAVVASTPAARTLAVLEWVMLTFMSHPGNAAEAVKLPLFVLATRRPAADEPAVQVAWRRIEPVTRRLDDADRDGVHTHLPEGTG